MEALAGYLCVGAFVMLAAVADTKGKRLAYELADGADLVVGRPVAKTFRCRRNGYFADVFNYCRVYHVCHQVRHADGSSEMQHFSFFCGNQTIFNQLSLTCTYPEDAVPCRQAPNFFYLNDRIGIENALLHTDTDIGLGSAAAFGARRSGGSRKPSGVFG
ncbi:U-scoloptoxin(01)-Cw1a-like [Rhipicephalus microplus]|uniref:U-scoloptoxin(01)-Cw1a-like n=1 Tax=Rhipicephalus microplus TaxID=6941 RepID=UPI003F6CECD5